MRIRSVGLKTELGLAATQGTLEDRGDHVVIRTPANPDYYFGNFLVLAEPPRDIAPWIRRFHDAFADAAGIQHVAFRWDATTAAGPLEALQAAGFEVSNDSVMTATTVTAGDTPYPIRELRADEMPAVAALALASSDDQGPAYRRFLERRAAWKGVIIERGLGSFWGAFDDDTLVGSLGLVRLDRLARYQDVQTAATHRGRGIASALLAAAAEHVTGVEQYVIVAEPTSIAARIYARAGFRVAERMVSAFVGT